MTSEIKAGNATNGVQITSDSTGVLEIKTGTGAGTTAMVLDASQNVGIGTSSPTAIAGYQSVTVNGSTSGLFAVKANGTDNGYIYSAGDGLTLDGKGATSDLILKTNGSERMRVQNSTGNVGIGTSSPSSRLHVNAAAGVNGVVAVTSSAGTGGFVQLAGNGNTLGTSSFDLLQGGDNVGYVYNRANAALVFGANNTEQARITSAGLFQFNSGYGSVATAFGCRAWVNFNGTGTVAIRASGNVSSITDNGTGDYTINFTTAMPDANYAVSGGCGNDNNDDRIISPTFFNSAPTTSGFRTRMTNNTGAAQDVSRITFQIIR